MVRKLCTESNYSGVANLSTLLAGSMLASGVLWFGAYGLALTSLVLLTLLAMFSTYPPREMVHTDIVNESP